VQEPNKKSINRFKPQQTPKPEQLWTTSIPTEALWGIYARQSTPAQLVNNTESTEMQTDDLIAWLVAKGVPEGKWELFDADLGVSGTLRIDQRSDLQRLVSLIEADKIKAVLVYQVSRLFRDDTGVQYNVFADICKQHDCILVTADGMVFNFRIPMCMKMFRMLAEMAADFLTQHVGLLHEARLRKARKGYYAGLGPVPSGFCVDMDKFSSTFKKITPLDRTTNPEESSHKEIVRRLYYRFYELGVENKSQFFRELDALPYIFPDFPLDIDKATKGSNRRRKVDGGFLMSRYSIERMLCNPANIGWWIVRGEIISMENHDPILEPHEHYLFWYAFENLSPYTTNGEVNTKRRLPQRRYHQKRAKRETAGLLKYRVTAPEGKVYVHWNNDVCAYKVMLDPSRVMRTSHREIEVKVIDPVFTELFFAKLEQTHDFDNYRQWLTKEKAKQEEEVTSLQKQLTQIDVRQEAIADEILDLRTEVKKGTLTKEQAAPQFARLRQKAIKLDETKEAVKARLTELTPPEEDETTKRTVRIYQSFQEELYTLKDTWHKKTFALKQDFVNLLVENVVLTLESPRWTRMDVTWAYPGWKPDTTYIYRARGKSPFWKDEEKDILRSMYPLERPIDILQALPTKSWASIRMAAMVIGVKRIVHEKNTLPISLHDSWEDHQFVLRREKGEQVQVYQVDESVKTE
jgi:DNA invertase Pin-like site-specific DNA recombinase